MAKLEPRSTSLADSRDLAANGLQQDRLEGSSAGWPGWLRLWGGSPFKYPGGNLPSNPKGRINTSEALKPAGFSHGISRGIAGAFFILGYAHHSPAIRCASGHTAKFLNAGAGPNQGATRKCYAVSIFQRPGRQVARSIRSPMPHEGEILAGIQCSRRTGVCSDFGSTVA